jgi:hypothetical protein
MLSPPFYTSPHQRNNFEYSQSKTLFPTKMKGIKRAALLLYVIVGQGIGRRIMVKGENRSHAIYATKTASNDLPTMR